MNPAIQKKQSEGAGAGVATTRRAREVSPEQKGGPAERHASVTLEMPGFLPHFNLGTLRPSQSGLTLEPWWGLRTGLFGEAARAIGTLLTARPRGTRAIREKQKKDMKH